MNIEKESPQPMEVDETSGQTEVQDDSEKTLGDLMQEKNLSFKDPSVIFFAQMSLSFLRDHKDQRDVIQKRVNFNVEEVLGIISTTAELQAGRGASILDGLDQKLAHKYDYKAFFQRIEELHNWHTEKAERDSYLAPYFSLIQSSGMGKTRLFVECHARLGGFKDVRCKTILCTPIPVKSEDYFDLEIDAKGLQTLQGDDKALLQKVNDVIDKLNTLIESTEEKFVVMLFDEAQGLMVGTDTEGNRSLPF